MRGVLVLLFLCVVHLAIGQQNNLLQKVVKERLGDSTAIEKNRDGSFHLATKHTENKSNHLPVTRFVVVRSYDWKVVEEGGVTMGQIVWSGEYELSISQAPGQVRLARDSTSTVRKIDLRQHLKGLAPR
ncbi:MAG: hypothetical protein ACOYW3_01510 [Bacteroidota bacterium]